MRLRTHAIGIALAAVVVLPAPSVSAGSREDSVAGAVVRVSGLTREKASFGGRSRRLDYMDLRFGSDTFSAAGVSGRYVQKGNKLRFRVDPVMLERYARSWEASYGDSLRRDGLDPDAVECEVTKAKLKGRARGSEVKVRSQYKIQCVASGDFGEIDAKGSVRFRGRGQISERANLPVGSGTVGLSWNFQLLQHLPPPPVPPRSGSAGLTISTLSREVMDPSALGLVGDLDR